MSKAKSWFSSHRQERFESVLCKNLEALGTDLHPDFLRMRALFVRRFGEVAGTQRYIQFVSQNGLDETKQYHPHIQFKESMQESFSWATPLISYLRQDKNAKYYAVTCLTANISMNNNDYTDPQHLAAAAISMNYMPVNLNHNHGAWFKYPATRLDWAKFEDMSVEGILRVDNTDRQLQMMLDHDPAISEKEWINHPSIEARPLPESMGGGYHFTGIAMLQKGYALPGDPLSEIQPLFTESIHKSLEEQFLVTCKIVDNKIMCKEKKSLNEQARNDAERAMSHFNISAEEWAKLSDAEKQDYIDKLPARGTAGQINSNTENTQTSTTEESNVSVEEAAWMAEKSRLIKQHSEQLREKDEEIKGLSKQLTKINKQYEESAKTASSAPKLQERIGKIEQEKAETEAEKDRLAGELKEQKRLTLSAEEKTDLIKKEVKELNEQIGKLQTQLESEREKLKKANIELATANGEVTEANKERDRARDELSEALSSNTDVSDRFSKMVEKREEAERALNLKQKELDKIKEELSTKTKALDALNEEVTGLRHDMKVAHKKDERRKQENLKKGIIPVSMLK